MGLPPDDPFAGYLHYVAARCQQARGFPDPSSTRATADLVKGFLSLDETRRPAWLNKDREDRLREIVRAAGRGP